jgi:tripartite ATP-independent transporter DctP family solute receptor
MTFLRKKHLMIFLVLMLAVTLVLVSGCSSNTDTTGPDDNETPTVEPKVAKLAHVGAPDHIFETGAQKFAELVFEKTNGTVKIETYPGGALGGDRDAMEGLQMGTVEFAIQGPIDSFLPVTSVVNMAYMFNGPEHVYEFLDGPVGEEVFSGLKDMGIVHLGQMENGWRLITSNKPINSVEDLKGLKIRVPESPIFRDAFIEWGASPQPIAFTELYGALQQKVVDAQENPVFHISTQRFNEVQTHVALTRHIFMNAPLLASQKFWDTLTAEEQDAIMEAAKEAVDFERKLAQEKEAELLADLEAKGMTITEPDVEEFRALVKPVHEKWAAEFGQDLYDRIVELGNK